jgi:hypothetical protein
MNETFLLKERESGAWRKRHRAKGRDGISGRMPKRMSRAFPCC